MSKYHRKTDPFTRDEDRQIIALSRQGLQIIEIARRIGRSQYATRNRATVLNAQCNNAKHSTPQPERHPLPGIDYTQRLVEGDVPNLHPADYAAARAERASQVRVA